jgi:glycosyltransferase involved in cell wall biosynthesis
MMKNRALVSFVMPVYKCRPEYLHASLASLLGQSYDNLELILVIDSADSGSDSAILGTLDAFRDDHRIRTIIRKGKKGYTSALNTGIRSSSGEFIARLDSDDYCDRTRIERQMETLCSSRTTLAGTWARVVDEQNREIGQVRTPVSEKSVRGLIMLHNPFVHSSIVFAKRVIEEIGLYNEAFQGAEDYELYLRLVSKGYQCINIPQFLTYLRETRNSITRGSGWRKTRGTYFRAKWQGVIRLKYRRGLDLLFAASSLASVLVTPRMSPYVKRAVGWYN